MSRLYRSLPGAIALLAALLLGSCGGGGGGGDTTPPVTCTPVIDSAGNSIPCDDPFWGGGGGGSDGDAAGADGTAGDGAAIVGAQVRLVDATGRTGTATTDAQGYYRINITRFTPPYVLTLTMPDGEERHHSFSTQAPRRRAFITINITGLTDKLASDVAVAAGQSGARLLTPAMVTANPNAITAALAQMRQTIRDQIVAAGLSPDSFDPIATFFRTNLQGHDLVLETVAVFLDGNGATQIVPKPQTACTTPRRWSAGANLCSPTTTPGVIQSGATLRLNDTTSPLVGSAEFACSNGNLTTLGTPTCSEPVTPQPCSAPASAWTVGGSTCNADSAPGGIVSGATLTLTDSQSPSTGSITYACTNGTLSQSGTPTCTTVSAKACAAPGATWTAGGLSCQADTTPTAMGSGTQQTLQDAVGTTIGSIVYGCTDGALSVQGSPTCSLASGSCAAPPASWTTGSATCNADVAPQPLASGQTVDLADTSGPDTGSASWRCTNGQLSVQSIPFCQTTQPTACAAPASNWSVQGRTCAADTAPTGVPSGSSLTLTDSSSPNVGAITYSCSNGTLSATGTPSCDQATSATCDTSGLANSGWTVGNNACKPDSVPTSVDSGVTVVLQDTLGDTTGSLSLQCINGGLFTVGEPSCSGPPPVQSCSVSVKNWTVSTLTCLPDEDPGTVVIPSGSTYTWVDSISPETGSHTVACSNGSASVINSTCGFSTGFSGSLAPKAGGLRIAKPATGPASK